MRKNKSEHLLISNYTQSYSNLIGHWHKNRHIDQWDRTDNPEINSCVSSQPVLDKNKQWEKNSLFKKWWWKTRHPYAKELHWTLILQYAHIQKMSWKRLEI